MSFLFRFIVCVLLVLAISVLAAMAWDRSDHAAAEQGLQREAAHAAAPG